MHNACRGVWRWTSNENARERASERGQESEWGQVCGEQDFVFPVSRSRGAPDFQTAAVQRLDLPFGGLYAPKVRQRKSQPSGAEGFCQPTQKWAHGLSLQPPGPRTETGGEEAHMGTQTGRHD